MHRQLHAGKGVDYVILPREMLDVRRELRHKVEMIELP